jgi:predicted metal-dependent phosphoesterase TrpH
MAFAVDLHTHTRHGSNCSYMEPADLVRRARLVGLDAVCITEHNAAWDEAGLRLLAKESPPLVFTGVEVSTELGDVLVFGANGVLHGVGRSAELRAVVDRVGGVMIAAHPFRRFFVPGVLPSVEEALANPLFGLVDAVEVFNGVGSRREQDFAIEVVSHLLMPAVAGSDSHAPHTLGCCYTAFEQPLATVEDLIRELRAGRLKALHPHLGLEFARGS